MQSNCEGDELDQKFEDFMTRIAGKVTVELKGGKTFTGNYTNACYNGHSEKYRVDHFVEDKQGVLDFTLDQVKTIGFEQ